MIGVCLGHQLLAHCQGGRIDCATQPLHGLASKITHDGSWPFEGIPRSFEAARYHSLVVVDEGSAYQACARDDDGTTMSILREQANIFQLGVQFHPESFLTPCGDRLMKNVCRRAGLLEPQGI